MVREMIFFIRLIIASPFLVVGEFREMLEMHFRDETDAMFFQSPAQLTRRFGASMRPQQP